MKNLYVIPGLGESLRYKNYHEVKRIAKETDIKIISVNINWEIGMDMSDFVMQAERLIPDQLDDSYILGFSFGAYIAAVISKKKKAEGFIFCSLSPYFKDDLEYIPSETVEYFDKKMMNSFQKYSFPETSKAKAWFLVGENDWSLAIARTKKAHRMWKGEKELVIVKEAAHELTNDNYVHEIQKIVKKL